MDAKQQQLVLVRIAAAGCALAVILCAVIIGRSFRSQHTLEGAVKMGPDFVDCWQYEAPPGSGNKASTCVQTYCQPRESIEDCEDRHDATVARRQQSKPPCGTP